MNWRWIFVALLGLVCVDAFLAVAAYGSKTWNSDRTEVLTGWDAVRQVCLIWYPTAVGVGLAAFAVMALAVRWARGGAK